MLPKLMTNKEVREYLKVGANTVYKMISQGTFPNARLIQGKWLVPENDILKFLNIKEER
jgi:excisionase family DNA binding protein